MEDKYQKLYESLKSANIALHVQISELQRLNTILEAEKRQWQTEKMLQQSIIQKALADSNATSNSYLEENKRLKEENKRLLAG